MKYRYQARTKLGELQTGFVEAGSRESAASILGGHELFILSLEEAEKFRWYDRISSYFSRVRRKDMIVLTRQLSMLLEAQLPLNRALRTLHEQTMQPALKDSLRQIIDDVDGGLSFSQSLERQGGLFSDFFVSMIRSSEATGNLSEAMAFLADYTEKEGALVSRALAALIYPAIIAVLFTGVVGVMIIWVFPQLGPVFQESGIELPAFSKLVIGSGDVLGKWWPAVLIGIFVLIMMTLSYAKTPEGRAFFDDLKIRMPIATKVYIPVTVTRFANAMAILLRGGIPVAQALEIVSHTVNNVLYEDALHEISDRVRQGEPLSQAIARYPDYFPPLVSQMIVVGEATGRLDQILNRLAAFYTQEADRAINTVVDLIQPLMMVVIGGLVGLLFASVLLPMSQLTQGIR